MRTITPYLSFHGNCREVMQFYEKCLGGQLNLMTYDGSPAEKSAKEHEKNYILHSSLTVNGNIVLMASDCVDEMPKSSEGFDGNVALAIECSSEEELRQQFAMLLAGGEVTMPVDKQFWGALFGMLKDKYGVHWMLSKHIADADNKTD